MNLARHAAVLWRFRAVAIGGVILGLLLALLAAYQISWDGGPSVKPRGSETWTSESSLLVTQPGFPEGRVTLPIAPTESLDGTVQPPSDTDGRRQEFADPNRFSALAQLYAQLAVSDRVLNRLAQPATRDQIEAVPVEGLAATQLPVIKLTTTAGSAEQARALNKDLVDSLRGVLSDDQAANDIPVRERTQVNLLNAPAAPLKTAGRSHTGSILAFLLCIIGAVALAHLLAALRDRGGSEEAYVYDLGDLELDGTPVPVPAGEAASEPAGWPHAVGSRSAR